MLQRLFALVVLLEFVGSMPATAQTVASPTRSHVEMLASEKLGGREAGSSGERLAADYLAAQLARIGARPLPGRSDMFLPFEFTAGSRDGGSRVVITQGSGAAGRATTFEAPGAVRALSFSDDGKVTGEVV